jgi:hypothetical protein
MYPSSASQYCATVQKFICGTQSNVTYDNPIRAVAEEKEAANQWRGKHDKAQFHVSKAPPISVRTIEGVPPQYWFLTLVWVNSGTRGKSITSFSLDTDFITTQNLAIASFYDLKYWPKGHSAIFVGACVCHNVHPDFCVIHSSWRLFAVSSISSSQLVSIFGQKHVARRAYALYTERRLKSYDQDEISATQVADLAVRIDYNGGWERGSQQFRNYRQAEDRFRLIEILPAESAVVFATEWASKVPTEVFYNSRPIEEAQFDNVRKARIRCILECEARALRGEKGKISANATLSSTADVVLHAMGNPRLERADAIVLLAPKNNRSKQATALQRKSDSAALPKVLTWPAVEKKQRKLLKKISPSEQIATFSYANKTARLAIKDVPARRKTKD